MIWEKIRLLDVFINEKAPWSLAKAKKTKELEKVLGHAAQGIVEVAGVLEIFLPATAQTIHEIFSQAQIKKGAPMFPRLQ